MIPKELISKIRKIQIHTKAVVTDVFAGRYLSVFKGRGMEFDEVREYQPGDEVRDIDWNVTARMGRPFIKKFVEERELTVMLLVDGSASQSFGTQERFKEELAAELSAVLAFSAIINQDKVGLIIFTDRIEKFVPPAKGSQHVLRVIRDILHHRSEGIATDISLALGYLNRVIPRRTVAFLISDFLAGGYERALKVAGRRHDLIAIKLSDPREGKMEPVGLVRLRDAETGRSVLIDSNDPRFRKTFADQAAKREEETLKLFATAGVDCVRVSNGTSYIPALLRFFRQRERKFH